MKQVTRPSTNYSIPPTPEEVNAMRLVGAIFIKTGFSKAGEQILEFVKKETLKKDILRGLLKLEEEINLPTNQWVILAYLRGVLRGRDLKRPLEDRCLELRGV